MVPQSFRNQSFSSTTCLHRKCERRAISVTLISFRLSPASFSSSGIGIPLFLQAKATARYRGLLPLTWSSPASKLCLMTP